MCPGHPVNVASMRIVCCSVLQSVAACCSVLQRVATHASMRIVCCSVLQRVAACCSVLQRVATHASMCNVCCRVLQSVAECCRVLQGVAECCRVLQHTHQCASCSINPQKVCLPLNLPHIGKNAYNALSCRSLPAKEPQITGLFCGKWPIKIRHPVHLRHPVVPPSILKR